jgi:chromate transporter
LSSFGGPEAHYGVFSNILVQKKKYVDEETLSEMIGVFALVPGPSSTQTITAIGYLVGGPFLAFFTFLLWAFPAIVMMTLIGVFFSVFVNQNEFAILLNVLPSVAIGFIAYAGWSLSKKVLQKKDDGFIFLLTITLGFLFLPYASWSVPILLILAGLSKFIWHPIKQVKQSVSINVPWIWLILLLVIAFGNLVLLNWIQQPWFQLMSSFYRYGYSVIGGGQIVIPYMIQDLVNQQSLITLETFLAGYAIDQAIPGPLFSFAAFVGVQASAGQPFAWLIGLVSGLVIFLPGILLVYFIFPIWSFFKPKIFKIFKYSPKITIFF